jgi:hypothetical protein
MSFYKHQVATNQSMVATFSTKPSDGYTVSSVLYKVKWALGTPNITARVAGALPGTWTYSNGAGTLTASATGTTTVDGQVLALNDIVLANATTTGITNVAWGPYQVTTAGAVGVAAVLTRLAGYTTGARFASDILVAITAGTVAAGFQYLHHGATVVLGTDPVLFTERGEPVGVWSFEISANSTNGTDGDWDPVDLTNSGIVQPASTASSIAIRIAFTCLYIRATYTPTTGTGVANVYVVGGGPR